MSINFNKLTDEDIKQRLKNFIKNVELRCPKIYNELDLRFLHNVTYKTLYNKGALEEHMIMAVNNKLILCLTGKAIKSPNKNDAIIINVLNNKSFLG